MGTNGRISCINRAEYKREMGSEPIVCFGSRTFTLFLVSDVQQPLSQNTLVYCSAVFLRSAHANPGAYELWTAEKKAQTLSANPGDLPGTKRGPSQL